MKRKSKINKRRLLVVFIGITLFFITIKLLFPSIMPFGHKTENVKNGKMTEEERRRADSIKIISQSTPDRMKLSSFYKSGGALKKNRIVGVRDYDESFPDSQSLQLASAFHYGVRPVANRQDAEKRKNELVYIGSNPYYDLKKLNSSVPYLLPRAAVLLQDIARTFMDSLQAKGVPINKILVSSVLRTKEDVDKLRQHNHNATSNSCHLYGTTFDIAYNRYATVTRPVRNDTLKWVLSEVLNDLRKQGRCYIKHEKLQGCFHITVK